jgi:hypothetical protein
MRDQGIDMPDPETNGGGGGAVRIGGRGEDRDKFQAAMQECEHFLEQAGGFRSEMDPEMLDRMVEFAQCMREHGIDMPDPQADGGIMIQRNDDGSATNGSGANIDPESEEFQAAQEACQPILGEDIGPRTDSRGPGGGDGPSVQTAPDGARP